LPDGRDGGVAAEHDLKQNELQARAEIEECEPDNEGDDADYKCQGDDSRKKSWRERMHVISGRAE
jgi:hypothetical protein